MIQVEGIDHVALAAHDVQLSKEWYMELLGFEHWHEEMWDGVPVFIGKGTTAIALFAAREEVRPPISQPHRVGFFHLAFRANRGAFEAAQRELKERGIDFDFQDHQISHSIYFDDPDGNELEITTYEV